MTREESPEPTFGGASSPSSSGASWADLNGEITAPAGSVRTPKRPTFGMSVPGTQVRPP